MASKRDGVIGAAVITAIAALIIGYWQFIYKPNNNKVKYSGRVINAKTQQIIPNIQVTVDTVPPQVCLVGSDGTFYVEIPTTLEGVNIRVEASGYDVFNRTVGVSRTGLEPISLTPINDDHSGGMTFDVKEPSLEEVRYKVAYAKRVSITYVNDKCKKAAESAKVEINNAQIEGSDAKEFLDNARSRTKLKYYVNIIKEGNSYEIVCQ